IYSLRNIPSGQKKKEFLRKYPALKVTALSKQHMLDYDNRNISVVPWGVDFDLYDFCEQSLSQSEESPNSSILREWQTEGTDYLVMVGAIGIHKSQSTAIEIAQKTNLRLIIAGTPQDTLTLKKTNYFKNEIVPHLSDKIVYFGNANEQQKIDLMRFAKASVAPFGFEFPKWKEPFGRTMIESMACGTPVIAYRNGSPIDMIKEGLSGYLFDTIEEAVEKVPSLDLLNRYETRKYAERLFNIKRVVDDYEKIFRTIV
ncbi:MAG: glycosyltransferase, partial [Candidatus Peribacteraceae bacterium]|nr:glycosyltransferase [Candidatus Peribacteraceae bacterium]